MDDEVMKVDDIHTSNMCVTPELDEETDVEADDNQVLNTKYLQSRSMTMVSRVPTSILLCF